MKLVVISYPKTLPKETEVVRLLFEKGMSYFHLRKTNSTVEEMEAYLDAIPKQYHSKIVVHSYWEGLKKYEIAGLHIREKDKACIDTLSQEYPINSVSVHHIDELYQLTYKGYKYAFLSPIFDSISKEHTKSHFQLEEVKHRFLTNPPPLDIVALGGIEPNWVPLIKESAFNGVAVLGYLWQNYDANAYQRVIEKYELIKNKIKEYS